MTLFDIFIGYSFLLETLTCPFYTDSLINNKRTFSVAILGFSESCEYGDSNSSRSTKSGLIYDDGATIYIRIDATEFRLYDHK